MRTMLVIAAATVVMVGMVGPAAAEDPGAPGASGASGASGPTATRIGKGGTREGASTLDRHWLNQAASSAIYKVTVGKLAQRKAGSTGVKQYGAMLIRDHTKSLEETNAVGKKLGVKLETRANPLQQQIIAMLSRMRGAQFDAFMTQIAVGDHKLDIEDAREAASNGLANDVRSLARKEQPVLQKHLREATKLAKAASSAGAGQAGAGADS